MFFGGQMGGGLGQGGFTTFSFGGPGGRGVQFGGPRRRPGAQAGAGPDGQAAPGWLQLLPLIILFGFSLVSMLPSLFSASQPSLPGFRFEPAHSFSLARQTRRHQVDYFVQPEKFRASAVGQQLSAAYPSEPLSFTPATASGPPELDRLERNVESAFVEHISDACRYEVRLRDARVQQNSGFLGIGSVGAEPVARADDRQTQRGGARAHLPRADEELRPTQVDGLPPRLDACTVQYASLSDPTRWPRAATI